LLQKWKQNGEVGRVPKFLKGVSRMEEKILESGIYAIIVNEWKMYIGHAINLYNRENQHFSDLQLNKHFNNHLQKAFNKYGSEAFRWEVLEYCEEKDLTEREQYYMDKYNVTNPFCGYNISREAKRSIPSEEGRKRIGEANRIINTGRKLPREQVEKMNKTRREKGLNKKTEEVKKKISQTLMNHKVSKETRKRIGIKSIGRKANLGKKWTEEQRKNQSRLKQGKICLNRRKYIENLPQWLKLKEEGLNYSEIGKRYNTNRHIVRNYIVKYYKEKIVESR